MHFDSIGHRLWTSESGAMYCETQSMMKKESKLVSRIDTLSLVVAVFCDHDHSTPGAMAY